MIVIILQNDQFWDELKIKNQTALLENTSFQVIVEALVTYATGRQI